MDSFTLYWKKVRLSQAVLRICAFLLLCCQPTAWAENTLVEIHQMQVEREEGGVFFSANLKFELPTLVEDALSKGIPMYFVAEVELLRDRWYWSDRNLATEERHMRLAYLPLTRRWRLNVSPTPIGNSGLGVTLNQNFDSLSDALSFMQRFSHWKIAEAGDLEFDGKTRIAFSFRLDVTQLPRPFQIGALGQGDWSLSGSRNLRLVQDGTR